MKRVAFYMTHPTQYHSPWFRALAASGRAAIHVYYGSLPNREQQGAGFGVRFEWDVPLLSGYEHTILNNIGSGSITDFDGIDAPEIVNVITKEKYDAWVINGWRTRGEWRAIRAALGTSIPTFIRGDSTLLDRRDPLRRAARYVLYRRWFPRFSCYLTVGSLNEQYYRNFGADSSRFVPVRHFVDNDWFRSESDRRRNNIAEVRRSWNIPESSFTFLFAGKFIPKKQPMDAIRAFAQATRTAKGVHMLMVGDGPLRAECERYCVEQGLPVTFAGFLNQQAMPSAYAASNALVLPSVRDETWGLVVNEAMASGLPAIVSDMVGCRPDLVIDGRTGSTFRAGDHESLSSRMSAYAADPARAAREGASARALIGAYSLESAVDNTITAIERFAA